MAKIAILRNSRLETFQGTTGKLHNVDIQHHGTDDAELYQQSGIYSRPQDGVSGVVIDCSNNNIVIASHDYKFDETIEKGETLIYSYDDSGVLQGKILIGIDGKITINNGTKEAARKDDAISSLIADDSVFWTWIAAAGAYLSGVGVTAPIPTSLTGKITTGSDEVLLP